MTDSVELNEGSTSRTNRRLAWILVVAAIVRIALLIGFRDIGIPIHDERDYNNLATNLTLRGEFAYEAGEPLSIRPPLYPAMVAAVYKVAGVENFQAVRVVQALISLANVYLVFLLGLRTYGSRAALWAAGIFAFYPPLLAFNCLILSETLFTFFLTAICLSAVKLFESEKALGAVSLGILIGLGALTRSVLWIAPVAVAAYLMIALRKPFLQRMIPIVLMIAAFAATIAPWAIRNTRMHKTFVTIDVMGGRNLMMGNYEHTPMFRSWATISVRGERSWHAILQKEHPDAGPLTQGQIDKLAMRRALAFMKENPWLTTKRSLVKLANFWQLERTIVAGVNRGLFGEFSKATQILVLLIMFGSSAFVMLSAAVGLAMAPPVDWRTHLFYIAVIVFLCALHSLAFAHSRYCLPLVPILSLYSAAALTNLSRLRSTIGSWRGKLAIALCCLLVGSWIWEIAYVERDRYAAAIAEDVEE